MAPQNKLSTAVRFPDSDVEYVVPSWAQLHELAFDVAQAISNSGLKFDRLITLSKGGWPMAVPLVDFLGITNVASIGVKFYADINKTLSKPSIYQSLPRKMKGEHVLLFDDVADSGKSLQFTVKHLKKLGVAKITTVTLLKKPSSVFEPDFYAAETSAWIIFPWEVAQAIKTLGSDWQKTQVTELEIKGRMKELGFLDHWVTAHLPH